jgi:uncharacterized membrane protein YgdD (TMEM256/DUF423 family)
LANLVKKISSKFDKYFTKNNNYNMYKPALSCAIIFGALAVIIGAFGAHSLKNILSPEQLLSFETGVRYQFYHCFALLFTGIVSVNFPSKYLRLATISFSTGIILFSGSIYALNILKSQGQVGISGLGILTPIGGVFLIIAWVMLFCSIHAKKRG